MCFDKLTHYNEYCDWTRLCREVVFIEMCFDKLAHYNEYCDRTRLCREVTFTTKVVKIKERTIDL